MLHIQSAARGVPSRAIYVNSEDCWSFFIEGRKLRTMTQLKISTPGLPAQRDTARHLIEQAGVALVYLGIVATFAVVTLIACVIWLLIS